MIQLGALVHTFNPSTHKAEAADVSEMEASLVYRVFQARQAYKVSLCTQNKKQKTKLVARMEITGHTTASSHSSCFLQGQTEGHISYNKISFTLMLQTQFL